MIVVRTIGLLLLIAGLAALGWDVGHSPNPTSPQLTALGELWYTASPATLNLAQALTQRYILPALWDPVMITVLLWPAALVFALPGLLLVLVSLLRRGHRVLGHRHG